VAVLEVILSMVASSAWSWVLVPDTVFKIPLPVTVRPFELERPAVWRPPAIVELAPVPMRLRKFAATPPLNELVEFVPVTFKNPAIVEVAWVFVAVKKGKVEVPKIVSDPEMKELPATERVVLGVLVPTPTLVFWVSSEKTGVAVTLVPKARALTALGRVVVAVR
jgi:hypothetical protein